MEINTENYLARFKVHNPKTLFPPNFELLRNGNCPICCHKIYWTKDKRIGYCKSKFKDGFKITRETASRLGIV